MHEHDSGQVDPRAWDVGGQGVAVEELPGGRAVCPMHKGPCTEDPETCSELCTWVEENSRKPPGAARES